MVGPDDVVDREPQADAKETKNSAGDRREDGNEEKDATQDPGGSSSNGAVPSIPEILDSAKEQEIGNAIESNKTTSSKKSKSRHLPINRRRCPPQQHLPAPKLQLLRT
jgi:hypothetical protein